MARTRSRPMVGQQRGWWLEDAIPGSILDHPGGRTVDEAEHVWLAWISNNVSDIHGNADAAGRGPWGQPLILGALAAAIVIGLAGPATPSDPAMGTIGRADGWRSIRLSGAVAAGDTLTARSIFQAVTAIGVDRAAGRVRRTIEGRNQRGEVVLSIEEERAVARRDPTGHAAA